MTGAPPPDALLVVAFGGPESPAEVIPFLEHVLEGRGVPRERLLAVAEHYLHFGGVSPIQAQSRALTAALEAALTKDGPRLPVYWGNRHAAPFLEETLRRMEGDGVRHALAFVPSAYGTYAGCRQYRDAIETARRALGGGAPVVTKLRLFFDHPRFVAAWADRLRAALAGAPADATLVFTAHSVPLSMARGSQYVAQLEETVRLVREAAGVPERAGALVWQSRSGPPGQPWLEPDVLAHLRALAGGGVRDVVLVPVGFLSDHMEVVWDLDTEAAELATSLGLRVVRAETPGTHPELVEMVRELVREHAESVPPRALGPRALSDGQCGAACCPAPARGAR